VVSISVTVDAQLEIPIVPANERSASQTDEKLIGHFFVQFWAQQNSLLLNMQTINSSD
jgi:hypothetical protein